MKRVQAHIWPITMINIPISCKDLSTPSKSQRVVPFIPKNGLERPRLLLCHISSDSIYPLKHEEEQWQIVLTVKQKL